jgi:hypothetical protein
MDDSSMHIFRSPAFQSVLAAALAFFNGTLAYPMPLVSSFGGSGVYAIYYRGLFPLYTPLAEANRSQCIMPIYAGKAVPSGWRTGRMPNPHATTLSNRLHEHVRSIQQGDGLDPADFHCRFMILHEPEIDLISVIEAELIRHYQPLWNTVIDGFGNHDPGSGRYKQARSEWDILHPGREWASRLQGVSPSHEAVIAKVQHVLTNNPS